MTRRPFREYRGVRYYRQSNGYWRSSPSNGHRYLHRAVYEGLYGPIKPGYHVHHLDGDTDNNRPFNLRALSPSQHHAEHDGELRSVRCVVCGAIFRTPRPSREILLGRLPTGTARMYRPKIFGDARTQPPAARTPRRAVLSVSSVRGWELDPRALRTPLRALRRCQRRPSADVAA